VQIHFPFCSPLRWYSVSPRASTRTFAPSVEFEAVLTIAPVLVVAAAGLLEAGELVDFVLELPHAASSTETARAAMNFVI
jgi:hypothetical protein